MVPRNIIDEIRDWVLYNNASFTPNAFARRWKKLDEIVDLPPVFLELKALVEQAYGLQGKQQEPMFRDYIGMIRKGGAIHCHSDPAPVGLVHTRFNVMISKPEEGGDPIIDSKLIEVEEGDVWICQASKFLHWTNEVKGSKPRIVVSFGYLIEE